MYGNLHLFSCSTSHQLKKYVKSPLWQFGISTPDTEQIILPHRVASCTSERSWYSDFTYMYVLLVWPDLWIFFLELTALLGDNSRFVASPYYLVMEKKFVMIIVYLLIAPQYPWKVISERFENVRESFVWINSIL